MEPGVLISLLLHGITLVIGTAIFIADKIYECVPISFYVVIAMFIQVLIYNLTIRFCIKKNTSKGGLLRIFQLFQMVLLIISTIAQFIIATYEVVRKDNCNYSFSLYAMVFSMCSFVILVYYNIDKIGPVAGHIIETNEENKRTSLV